MRIASLGGTPRAHLWDGDSHTAENVAGVGMGYPSHCLAQLQPNAPPSLYTNIALGGSNTFHTGYDVHRERIRVAILLIGTNVYRDITGGTAAQVEALYTNQMSALRGVGYHKVLITTCPPSTYISTNEAQRLLGNAALSGLGADGVIDLAADSVCGNVANYTNGVIGTDGIHSNPTGCIQWARVAVPVIRAALRA